MALSYADSCTCHADTQKDFETMQFQAQSSLATMSYSDSTAVFKKRFLEIGLSEANFDAFDAEGLNTMGTFAFACNYAPGVSDERPLVALATKVLGVDPTTKEMACVRRLFSEAYSTIAADIRSKVEASDEAAVKKLAPAERSQRLRDQQLRLAGIDPVTRWWTNVWLRMKPIALVTSAGTCVCLVIMRSSQAPKRTTA